MKKILTSLLFTFTILNFANATHNYGGEITVKQLSYLNYEAMIHTYTKESSSPADRDSLEICWGDGICEYIVRDTFYSLGKDIKCNTYTWQHTYAEEATYTISMTDPNRNGGILNVNPPSSDNVPFHVQTKIVVSTFYNNTPVLLNPPTDWGYLNQVYQHNPAAIDWEGDSLVYEIGIPLQGVDLLVPNFMPPSNIPIPNDPNNILSINTELGTVTWATPQLEGDYAITIKISEYRNGEIISIVTRDFTIPIKDAVNQAPTIDVPIDEVTLSVGDTLKFDVEGVDPEMGEVLVKAIGQPFLLDNPPTFNVPTDFTNGPINSNFEWKIFDNHVYLNPYYLVFRIEEKDAVNCGLTDYHVLKININDSPTNVDENRFAKKELDVDVFPNPVPDGNIFVKINDKKERESVQIQIISLDGKVLLENQFKNIDQIQRIDLQGIISGNYFLILESNTKTKVTQITIK
ncbi:MAG: T9SS type A sorting domain-containing protein [Saprospiraceae bacterium]